MKKIIITLGLFSSLGIYAQNNVGIGTFTPNSQAILEIKSSDKGVLISRLTTVARNTLGTALTATEDGMLVYDKDLTAFYYWDGPNLQWVQVGSGNGDNWGTDVVQTSGANISGDGTLGNPLTVTDADSDPTNEIELPTGGTTGQVLSTDGSGTYTWVSDNSGTDIQNIANLAFDNTTNILTVGIDNGNSQTIDLTTLLNDADSDPTNEIQDLTINTTTNILTITNNGTPTSIDLTPYLDNTDAQDLSLTGNTLSLSNDGTTVDLSGYLDNTDSQNLTSSVTGGNTTVNISGGTGTSFSINDADSDPTNEYNTGANLSGNSLNIIDAGGTQTVNLSSLTDADWYKVGTTTAPTTINDNIFTQGNVGIGTATPGAKLEVIESTLNTALIVNKNFNGLANTDAAFIGGTDAGFTNTGIYVIQKDNIGLSSIGSNTFNVVSNSISQFVVRGDGNIGINTITPTNKLDINGDLRVRTIVAGTSTDQSLVVDATGVVKKVAPYVPPGGVMPFAMATAPAGWLTCNGAAVSRTTYAGLFLAIGTTYGVGNGTTTFNLPDLRGEFVRGADAGRGIDIGRVNGSFQNASQVSYISNTSSDCPSCGTLGAAWSDAVWGSTGATWENVTSTQLGGPQGRLAGSTAHQVTKVSGSTRPRNIAMNYCIKF